MEEGVAPRNFHIHDSDVFVQPIVQPSHKGKGEGNSHLPQELTLNLYLCKALPGGFIRPSPLGDPALTPTSQAMNVGARGGERTGPQAMVSQQADSRCPRVVLGGTWIMIKPKEKPSDFPLWQQPATPVTCTTHQTSISPVPHVKDLPRHIAFILECAWGVWQVVRSKNILICLLKWDGKGPSRGALC